MTTLVVGQDRSAVHPQRASEAGWHCESRSSNAEQNGTPSTNGQQRRPAAMKGATQRHENTGWRDFNENISKMGVFQPQAAQGLVCVIRLSFSLGNLASDRFGERCAENICIDGPAAVGVRWISHLSSISCSR